MRYAASEKLEIIELVEGSHLPARQTLAKLGLPRTTFYRWYDRYLQRGKAGLQDQSPKPKHVWNRIPDEVRRKVVKLALTETELSPRELAVTFTDQESYPRPLSLGPMAFQWLDIRGFGLSRAEGA